MLLLLQAARTYTGKARQALCFPEYGKEAEKNRQKQTLQSQRQHIWYKIRQATHTSNFCYQSQEEVGSELIPFSLFIPLVCTGVENIPMQIRASGVKESLSEYLSVNRSYSSSESAHPRLSNGRVLKSEIVIKLLCAHFVPRLVLGAAGIRATGTEE